MNTQVGLRVMYVDDEPSALINFRYTLQNYADHHQVQIFQVPDEALDYVRNNPIDIAFLDIDMGKMDGFTLSKKLKAICPKMAVAFVTGNIRYMSQSRQEVKAPYIFKPYSPSEILDVLNQGVS